MSLAPAPLAESTLFAFAIGERRLAVPARCVARVVRMPRLTRVPHAPAGLLGVANVHGTAMPVIALENLLGEPGPAARAFLVELEIGLKVALAVDRVDGLRAETSAGLAPHDVQVTDDTGTRVIDLPELLGRHFAAAGRPPAPERVRQGAALQAKDTADARRAFATFLVGTQRLALPLDEVREVARLPVSIRLDGHPVDLGTISYRGGILPLVALAALLGLAGTGSSAGARIVVTQIGAALVGLVVDALAAVVRLPESAIGPVPAVLNRGGGPARIAAMGRLEGGDGLVSILATRELFSDAETAAILAGGTSQQEATEIVTEARQERFVLFSLGDEVYGLPLDAVDEVVRVPIAITRVPGAPGFIEGVFNLRGAVIPLIDQSRRFQAADLASTGRRVLITRVGAMRIGFIVDAASELAAIPEDRITPVPSLASGERPLFDRVADWDGRLILLIEPQALLAQAETDLLATLATEGRAG